MKNTLLTLIIICISLPYAAQVAIGKESVDGDGILDFVENSNKGLALPKVDDLSEISENGTLIYDINDGKVKYYDANQQWIDLSKKVGTTANANLNNYSNLQDSGNGVVIGASSTTVTSGVLVLESQTKALILPKMENPHLNIKDPEPGMMAYDTVKKMMCVFNGSHWTYWGK